MAHYLNRVALFVVILLSLFSCEKERGPTKITARFFDACDDNPVVNEKIKIVGREKKLTIFQTLGYLVFEKEVTTDENGLLEFIFEPLSYSEDILLFSQSGEIATKTYSSEIDFGTIYKALPERYVFTIKTDSLYDAQDTLFFFSSRFSNTKFITKPEHNQVVVLEAETSILNQNELSIESSPMFFNDKNFSRRSRISIYFSGSAPPVRADNKLFVFSLCGEVLEANLLVDKL